MPVATLLDIAKLRYNDKVVGLIEENLASAPEVANFPMRTIKGTSFLTVKRTNFPTTGFRTANSGITKSKSEFAQALVQCFIFGGAIEIDKAVADANEDGPAAFEMTEASGVMKSALINLGKQVWYGVTNDALGFPGIKAITPKDASVSPAIIDAAGTTATTASSLYAVKYGEQNAQLILGENGRLELPPFQDQALYDSLGKMYPGRVSNLSAWTGLAVNNKNCVGRICNLTEDSGKGLTDAQIAKLLALFPVGFVPDAFYCSRRSRRQLQVSRTVVLNAQGSSRVSGAVENVAPVPTEAFGIPIIATDSILNTDAIE